jgi:aminoglycoside phosphotransferase family enzyme
MAMWFSLAPNSYMEVKKMREEEEEWEEEEDEEWEEEEW